MAVRSQLFHFRGSLHVIRIRNLRCSTITSAHAKLPSQLAQDQRLFANHHRPVVVQHLMTLISAGLTNLRNNSANIHLSTHKAAEDRSSGNANILHSADIQAGSRRLGTRIHQQEDTRTASHSQQANSPQFAAVLGSPKQATTTTCPACPQDEQAKTYFSQSKQRSQIRLASLLLLTPIAVHSMAFCVALLDIVKLCSLVSLFGLRHTFGVDTALGGNSLAGMPRGAAGMVMAAIVSLHGWMAKLYNTAINLQPFLDTGRLLVQHSSRVYLNYVYAFWVSAKVGAFDQWISIIQDILAHNANRSQKACTGKPASYNCVAENKEHEAQFPEASNEFGSSLGAANGSSMSEATFSQVWCPAADAMMRVALGFCIACMAVVRGTEYGAVLSAPFATFAAFATFCLSGVQLVAAVMYFWKAWSPDCVQYYSNHGQEIIKQVLKLIACQALLYAVLCYPMHTSLALKDPSRVKVIIAGNEDLNRMVVGVAATLTVLGVSFVQTAIWAEWHIPYVKKNPAYLWFAVVMAVIVQALLKHFF